MKLVVGLVVGLALGAVGMSFATKRSAEEAVRADLCERFNRAIDLDRFSPFASEAGPNTSTLPRDARWAVQISLSNVRHVFCAK